MTDGRIAEGRTALTFALIGVLGLFAFACGGGGSSSEDTEDLWVERFSVPNFSGILLDEAVSWVFSEGILQSSLNFDNVRVRTGDTGGETAEGTLVVGTFLYDSSTSSRVVVDPDQIPAASITEAEAAGVIPAWFTPFRYDLGARSPLNGDRQALFNRALGRMMTLVPNVPTRTDLSDTGYQAGHTYSVVLPAFPALNTVISIGNDPLLPREGRVFTSTFTTVPSTAPQLFLGGENQGRPRVINTDPVNGGTNISVTSRIRIRFSHPIDPRSLSTDNFFLYLLIDPQNPPQPGDPAPGAQTVSLFLRQTRLGICEVVLTPLSNLTGDRIYQVAITSGVRDLLGNTLAPFTYSFTTGQGFQPSDIDETFVTKAYRAEGTNALWDTTYDRNGDTVPDGALIGKFAPWAGNGADGAFQPPVGQITTLFTTDPATGVFKEFQYESVLIETGATVEGEGKRGLVMRSQGDFTVAGEITVSGSTGVTGQTGGTGNSLPTGGAGGTAGAGGYDGGDGAFTVLTAANYHGLDGSGPYSDSAGRGGHTGDRETCTNTTGQPCTDETGVTEGGGGGGHSEDGEDASLAAQKPSLNPNIGGTGGKKYDAIDPPLVPVDDPVLFPPQNWGGAGGGGGGGEDDSLSGGNGDGVAGGQDEGGGGGGGGGGGLIATSYKVMTISGRILANGGGGGNTYNVQNGNLGQGGPGGGGAGGAIYAQCLGDMDLQSGAEIEALGGGGGSGGGDGYPNSGGDGSEGYIFLQDKDGQMTVPASVDPTPSVAQFEPEIILDSVGIIGWFDQYIVTPNYDPATVDMETNDGTITVWVQGSREDLANPGFPVDPDLDVDRVSTTAWTPIAQIDSLDNYRFLRIKVEFTVDPAQTFGDVLPVVHRITIPVQTQPD